MDNVFLITKQEIATKKQISLSSFDSKLNQMILEAQMQDIKPLLGRNLYNDILRTVGDSLTTYDDLLNGVYYEDDKERNPGLKSVLIEYTYARNIMFGSAINTVFGNVKKLNQGQSEPLNLAEKKTLYNNHRQYAYSLWLEVERYILCTNIELYKGCRTQNRNNNLRVRKIGKN